MKKKQKKTKKHCDELEYCSDEVKKTGFFNLPLTQKAKNDHGIKKFLIFYFDEDDYKKVLSFFKIQNSKKHPILDSKKLVGLIDNVKK